MVDAIRVHFSMATHWKELALQAPSVMEIIFADSHEAIDEAGYLSAKFEHLVREFERALAAHQIELPYAPSLAGYQFIQADAALPTFARWLAGKA